MRHGFKAEAERKSKRFRKKLGLDITDPLPARTLASHLDVLVMPPGNLPNFPETLVSTLTKKHNDWSAATIVGCKQPLIIYNPAHSERRQESDLMHELSHLIEEHEPRGIQTFEGGLLSRSYDEEQEKEAAWLGGCLQLPRPAVFQAARRGIDNSEIADYYCASKQMVRYRRNVTGVNKQLEYMRD